MPQLEAAARKQGFESLSEVSQCILEPGGTLTFVGKKPGTEDVRHKELLDRLDLLRKRLRRSEDLNLLLVLSSMREETPSAQAQRPGPQSACRHTRIACVSSGA